MSTQLTSPAQVKRDFTTLLQLRLNSAETRERKLEIMARAHASLVEQMTGRAHTPETCFFCWERRVRSQEIML